MRRLRAWLLRLAGVAGFGRRDAEIAEELLAHREMLVEEYQRRGLSADEARRRVAREFGTAASATHAYRDRRGLPALEHLLRDVRMACRSLIRTPVLTLSMLLVLGLGVGLGTAIAAVFHTVVWGQLPVADADAVVRATVYFEGGSGRGVQGQVNRFSYPELNAYRDATRTLAAVTGAGNARVGWRSDQGVTPLRASLVTGDYFRVLPAIPIAGRLLTPADARQPVAVISHALWQRAFASAGDVVGRTMWIDRSAFTVAGIAPPSFEGHEIEGIDVWLPLEAVIAARGDEATLRDRNLSWLQILGRMAPGANMPAVAAEAAVIATRFDTADPGRRTTIQISRASRLEPPGGGPGIEDPVTTVGAVAVVIMGLLFLICGSNAAALLLARGASRQREIAVRVALGAGSFQISRQIAVEIAVVAIASAAVGVALCIGTLRALSAAFPMPDLLQSIQPDIRVFGFALAVATLVAVFFGLAPVRQARRVDCLSVLKGEAVAFGRRLPALRLRRSLIAIQIAISAVLLVVAGLFGRSVAQAWLATPGYEIAGLHLVQPDGSWVPGEAPRDGGIVRQRVVDLLRAVPGVSGIAQATLAPFSGTGHSLAALAAADSPTRVHFNQVDPQFFATLGVPLLAGRGLASGDGDAAIVNAALARRFWGGDAAAIGRVLFVPVVGEPEVVVGEPGLRMRPVTVIGVVPTLQTTTVGVPDEPTYYTLLTERDTRTAFLVVRAGAGVPLARLAAEALRSADPDALLTIEPIEERLLERTEPGRVAASVAGLIGLLALAVAAVGIHGVIAYTITCRTREIGLHQALGARPIQVLRVVFGWTLRGVAIGAVAGLVILATAAVILRRPLTELLNGVNPLDPAAFAAGLGALILVVLLAIALPARRAVSLSPLAALRRE